MTRLKVLILGATGYIGGPICQRLIRAGYHVTALVRTKDSRAELLHQAGVEIVIGTLDSVDLIREHASESDVVFACASTSHMPSAEAILEGFKLRRKQRRRVGILIHTSGTGIFATGDARGLPPSSKDKSYSDLDVAAIEALGTAHPQRKVHVKIIAAAEAGDVRSYIILPSTIFGVSSQPRAGRMYNKHSSQMPALIRASIKRRRAGLVGEYRNTWPLVHTDDLTDLYELVLHAALSGKDCGNGRNGYYVAANGQYVCREAAEEVGRALRRLGLADTAEPSRFSADELQEYFGDGADFAGTNSQATSERSHRLGWQPRGDLHSFLASLDPEVEMIWKEEFREPR
ncbi:hypothetical protein JCM10908_004335 [Rhodotorula pacifica]|uniref:uncharacterized protein n=1 Tax=Rhodotorula pacifica TaxID=1495444 RepID=UPI00317E2FB2